MRQDNAGDENSNPDDIIVAKLLKYIVKDYGGGYYELSSLLKMITETKDSDYGLVQRIRERIKVEKIADLLHNDSDIAPNNKTYGIIREGGYLSYVAAEKKKEKRQQ
jgi:hypothetical protein